MPVRLEELPAEEPMLSADQMLSYGLVDQLISKDEALKSFPFLQAKWEEKKKQLVSIRRYAREERASRVQASEDKSKVAVIFAEGDIIYGEVSKVNKLGTNITLKKPDYGVVLAFCTRCKKPLKLDNSGQRPILKCTAGCNLPEGRLISPYYGNLRGILERYKVENL